MCVSGNRSREVQLWLSVLRGCVCHESEPAEAQAVESFREAEHEKQDRSDHGAVHGVESQD